MKPLPLLKTRLKESVAYTRVDATRRSLAAALGRRSFRRALRPTDVFLVGHPKSGNTWMAYLLAILREARSAEAVTLANLGRHVPVVHGADSHIAGSTELAAPRIFRNEWPVYPELYPRTVYLVRDPRAVLVSMYHMFQITYPDDPRTLAGFVDEYLAHGCIRRWEPRLVRWDRQVEAWLARAQQGHPVLTVRYEDMVDDLFRVLERVALHLGLEATPAQVDAAVARGSFEAMRRDEDEHGAESYPGEKRQRGRFIRRGRKDGWKDELPAELAARVVAAFAPTMKRMGYAPEPGRQACEPVRAAGTGGAGPAARGPVGQRQGEAGALDHSIQVSVETKNHTGPSNGSARSARSRCRCALHDPGGE